MTTGPQPTLDVVHFEALAMLQEEGQPPVLGEMARLFVGEASAWLADAHRAVASGDLAVLRSVAHSLKGVCGTIGAKRMRGLAVELERLLAMNRVSDAASPVRALNEELGRLIALLDPYAHAQAAEPCVPRSTR